MLVIIHADLNSFFASVEQQAEPKLRFAALGITSLSQISAARALLEPVVTIAHLAQAKSVSRTFTLGRTFTGVCR